MAEDLVKIAEKAIMEGGEAALKITVSAAVYELSRQFVDIEGMIYNAVLKDTGIPQPAVSAAVGVAVVGVGIYAKQPLVQWFGYGIATSAMIRLLAPYVGMAVTAVSAQLNANKK